MKYILLFLLLTNAIYANNSDSQCTKNLPVEIVAEVNTNSATVDISFHKDLKDVNIEIVGTDGLVVTLDAPIEKNALVLKNDTKSYKVAFEAPGKRSYIAVYVSGVKNGRFASVSKTFAVVPIESISRALRIPTPGYTLDVEGNKIKVMSATRIK